MDFGFRLTAQAKRDLKAVWRHIAYNSLSDATDFRDRLIARAESLTTFPNRHGSWVKEPNIRKVPFGSYIIFYKIHDRQHVVEILRFRHAARDQSRLRLKEDATTPYSAPAMSPPA